MVAATLSELQGNIAGTAKRFNVTRTAVQNLVRKRPALQKVVIDAREGMKDNAESSLYRAVLRGESWAVCFYLKTQAKDRGYIERVEQTGADGSPMNQGKQNVNVAVINTMPSTAALAEYLRDLDPTAAALHQNGDAKSLDSGNGVCPASETGAIPTPHDNP